MTKPAIVFYVIGSLHTGGSERHLMKVLPRLDRSRWLPMVYCTGALGSGAEVLKTQGIRVFGPPIESSPRRQSLYLRLVRLCLAWLKLVGLFLRWRPLIAHFVLPAAYVFGVPAAVVTRVPIKIMSRRSMSHYQSQRPALRRLEHLFHHRMTAILVNSRAVRDDIAAEPGVRADRVALIYNGIDPTPFETSQPREVTRAALNLGSEVFVISIVANLISYKGHDVLLQALAQIRTSLPPDWRLMVIGRDDGIGDSLRMLAQRLEIGEHICWLGERSDVPNLLAASDVGVLCSHEEGFSNAILEGMAAHLPMVVTDVGGNAEAVIDGETGIVVPPADPSALGAAILRLVRDRGLARQFGEQAHKRVHDLFSLERCVGAYEAFYDAVLRHDLGALTQADSSGSAATPLCPNWNQRATTRGD